MIDIYRRFLPLTMLHASDTDVFAALCPEQHQWLIEHAIPFEVSIYRWPEMMAQMLGCQIGTTVCEIRLTGKVTGTAVND